MYAKFIKLNIFKQLTTPHHTHEKLDSNIQFQEEYSIIMQTSLNTHTRMKLEEIISQPSW